MLNKWWLQWAGEISFYTGKGLMKSTCLFTKTESGRGSQISLLLTYTWLSGLVTYLRTVKTRAIFPMARILFLITSFLAATAPSVTKANTHSWTNPAEQNSTRDLPEHSEHPSHFSNGSNFVTDHFFPGGNSTSWKIMAIIKLH